MRSERTILGSLSGRVLAVPRMLASVLVLWLPFTASARAQESDSSRAAASVDESFAAFHQALSATANELLARAQRPPATRSDSGAPAAPGLTADLVPPVEQQTRASIRLQQVLQRVQALRPTLEPILREQGIPPQMTAVVLVESGGQTAALSPKGARGLWQIMPDTARRYGLVVTDRVDERLDLYKSTRAAGRYLRDLYTQFGNWPLALAAYNAGEDAVERAIVRASSRDFNSIARAGVLPLETQNYVPAVLNAMAMMKGTAGKHLTTGAGKSASAATVTMRSGESYRASDSKGP